MIHLIHIYYTHVWYTWYIYTTHMFDTLDTNIIHTCLIDNLIHIYYTHVWCTWYTYTTHMFDALDTDILHTCLIHLIQIYYTHVWYDNLCKNDAGRGMILYIDSCVKYSPINIDIDFQKYICVEFSLKNKDKLLLASIYRSPSSTVVKELRSKMFCQLPVQVT